MTTDALDKATSPASKAAGLPRAVKRIWSFRKRYGCTWDWLLSFYQRLLARFPRVPLPARNRERQVRLDTSDWYVLEEIFLDRVYEPTLRQHNLDIHNIVDLGANAGYSLRLWRRA